MDVNEILSKLDVLFPNAKCELDHETPFQLLIAVTLSAQTTDVRVNIVTKDLFKAYPDAQSLAKADIEDVSRLIKSIGLYKNKSQNIIALSKKLLDDYDGIVPEKMEELITLDGVGRKTANVVMSVCYHVPAIAVDTHVERVSKRLGLVQKNRSVLDTERILMRKIPKDKWISAHHLFIFFGRYMCNAKNPNCTNCPFTSFCKYYNIWSKK